MQRLALSAEQLERFERDGYVIAGQALSPTEVTALGAEIERICAELPPDNRPENIRDPHTLSRLFLDLCLAGPIVDCAEQILGPDPLMWGTYGFAKPPGEGLRVDWHQDARYFPLQPMETVTAWLAVDDAERANGCLQVIPRSHAPRRIYEHRSDPGWGRETTLPLALDAHLETERAVPLQMPAGWVSFHDPYVVHGSGENRSDRRRCGIQILYMTKRVRLDADDRQSMGLDWRTLKIFHCRPEGAPRYHYPHRPDEVFAL